MQVLMMIVPYGRAHTFGFGWDSPLFNSMVDVTLSKSPSVQTEIETKFFEGTGLRHSWLHDSPEVADYVRAWMRRRASFTPGGTSDASSFEKAP
jgi:hypothetical protein